MQYTKCTSLNVYAMGRQSNKIKIYLFIIFIFSSFVVVVFHFKRSNNDDAYLLSDNWSKGSNCDCSCASEMEKGSPSKSLTDERSDIMVCPTNPSSLVEQTRRHISQTARHQWLFMKSQIRILQKLLAYNSSNNSLYSLKLQNTIKYMLDYGSEYSSVIDLEVKKLGKLDGWDEWRLKESQELKEIIQERLARLQNPANCSTDPVLVCNLTNHSGFASGVHDVLWCFIKAYSSQHRLVLETSHWHYARSGWDTVFRPVSEVCHDDQSLLKKVSPWPGQNSDKARRLLRTLPEDLGKRIIRIKGNPLAWWYGQFLWYLMRPNDQLQSVINSTLNHINFSKPIVGIHVRRTDKVGTEAISHKLEEYMDQAEEYFQSIELIQLKSVKRRVYIATDEPSVLKECHEKYPHYDCLYNPGSAEMATNMKTRYSNQSLWSLITDIFALSHTDYIVCTMSSGLCRVAYELKLALDESSADVSDKVASLDIPHHYAWLIPPSRKAIYNHKSRSLKEISFLRGDVLVYKNDRSTVYASSRGKLLDGLMKMINKMENTEGLVPIYKTREMFQLQNVTSA